MIMKNAGRYYNGGENTYLKKSARILEIILEEYSFLHLKYNNIRFIIPRIRFEYEGLSFRDINYCLENYINQSEKGKPVLILENNLDKEVQDTYETNQIIYSENYEFTLNHDQGYNILLIIHSCILSTIERREILQSTDISNFLNFNDGVFFLKTLNLSIPIQIDLTEKINNRYSNIYYFAYSIVTLAKLYGVIKENKFIAIIPQDALINHAEKERGEAFEEGQLNSAKSHFMNKKLKKRGKDILKIDFKYPTKEYLFELNLG